SALCLRSPIVRPPLRSALFPCTTLFRSVRAPAPALRGRAGSEGWQFRGAEKDHARTRVEGEPPVVPGRCHRRRQRQRRGRDDYLDRKSTRLNSSHVKISYAVFCLKKKNE